jgi:hypothetical protein
MLFSYALERFVTGPRERAAGAQTTIAPAARRPRLARWRVMSTLTRARPRPTLLTDFGR